MSAKLTAHEQAAMRAIMARLLNPDDVTLFTVPRGDRWVTDTYVALRLTGCAEVASIVPSAPTVVASVPDGTYKLTVGKGFVPISGRVPPEYGLKLLAKILDRFEDAETATLAPTPWVVSEVGSDSATRLLHRSDGATAGVDPDVLDPWADQLHPVKVGAPVLTLTQRTEGRAKDSDGLLTPILVTIPRRLLGSFARGEDRERAEQVAASVDPEPVALIMPRRVAELPAMPVAQEAPAVSAA